jgi:hypothetical protein
LTNAATARVIADRLADAGVGHGAIRLGGNASSGAAQLGSELGIAADIDPSDPLKGAPGLDARAEAGLGIDRGGAIGGAVGAAAGAALGLSRWAGVVPVAPAYRMAADIMLLLAVGIIAGAALGGALGPRRSTHAGFALIDAMEEGHVAVVVCAPAVSAPLVYNVMEEAGAESIVRLP